MAAQPNPGQANAHGLQVLDIRPGRTVNIDQNAAGVAGMVLLQQNGFNGWTVTRAPYLQANGTVVVPIHKGDIGVNRVYVDSVPFEHIVAAMGGRRHRRRTTRRRRAVTRRRRHHV